MDFTDGSPRERILLAAMAGAVVLALLVFALRGMGGAPDLDEDALETALRDFQTVETALAARPANGAATATQPFSRARVIASAQSAQVTLQRIEPGDGALTVTVAPGDGARVMAFVADVERQTTARITELDMDAGDGTLVEARVTFTPPPS